MIHPSCSANVGISRDELRALLSQEIAKYADEMPLQFASDYLADALWARLHPATGSGKHDHNQVRGTR